MLLITTMTILFIATFKISITVMFNNEFDNYNYLLYARLQFKLLY
jgi:hypothetical protein